MDDQLCLVWMQDSVTPDYPRKNNLIKHEAQPLPRLSCKAN